MVHPHTDPTFSCSTTPSSRLGSATTAASLSSTSPKTLGLGRVTCAMVAWPLGTDSAPPPHSAQSACFPSAESFAVRCPLVLVLVLVLDPGLQWVIYQFSDRAWDRHASAGARLGPYWQERHVPSRTHKKGGEDHDSSIFRQSTAVMRPRTGIVTRQPYPERQPTVRIRI